MFQLLKRRIAVFLCLMIIGSCANVESIVPRKIKVIAFDAFPIFDPREIAAASEQAFPGQGQQLMELWRTRIFEYQWLRALGTQYEDFMSTAEAGLIYAANQLNLNLTSEKKRALLQEFLALKPWPDVAETIPRLKEMGLDLVFLSNMTEEMLGNGLKQAGLENEFRAIFSTDAIHTYKPDPRAYALAVEKLGVSKDEILFVAFAGWDVAGAKWFGYRTFWVNRTGAPTEELAAQPDGVSRNLSGLVEYINQYNQAH